jgi:hypothetical protein
MTRDQIVFLVDVDDTLLDNDPIRNDLKRHLEREFGAACRILSAVKSAWGDRVTTVFPRQRKFAHDPVVLTTNPPADLTVERIGELLNYDLAALLAGHETEVTR